MTTEDDGRPAVRTRSRCPTLASIGVVVVCLLHSFAGSTCRLLLLQLVSSPAVQEYADHLPLKWPPGHWLALGDGCGCLLGAGLALWCGTKSTLQVVAAPLLVATYSGLYYLPKIEFQRDEFSNTVWVFAVTACLFLQGCASGLSELCVPLYLMDCVCRCGGCPSKRSKVGLLVLAAVQLPRALAALLFHTASHQLVGVVPMPVLVLVVALYLPLPESPVWLLVSRRKPDKACSALNSLRSSPRCPPDRPEPPSHISAELLQLQKLTQSYPLPSSPAHSWYSHDGFGGWTPSSVTDWTTPDFHASSESQSDDGLLRPLLVSCGVTLLGQFSGSDVYSFYSGWAFREASVSMGDVWLSACGVAAVTLSAGVHWRCGGGPTPTALLVVISTGVAMTCLFATGSLLHGLEDGGGGGGGGSGGWLPATLLLVHTWAHRGGVSAHWLVVACTAAPSPSSRLLVLTSGLLLYTGVSHLNSQALGLLITVLHPFGVFWLHASLSAIGLVYLATVVEPELRYTAKLADRTRADYQELRMTTISP